MRSITIATNPYASVVLEWQGSVVDYATAGGETETDETLRTGVHLGGGDMKPFCNILNIAAYQ